MWRFNDNLIPPSLHGKLVPSGQNEFVPYEMLTVDVILRLLLVIYYWLRILVVVGVVSSIFNYEENDQGYGDRGVYWGGEDESQVVG